LGFLKETMSLLKAGDCNQRQLGDVAGPIKFELQMAKVLLLLKLEWSLLVPTSKVHHLASNALIQETRRPIKI
jgi:hypothetical protein